jgi:arylsulfotransferase ASST
VQRPAVAIIVCLAGAAIVWPPPCASAARAPRPHVTVSPLPGSDSATPETQISFRGASARRIATVVVRGSRTGRHRGALRQHGDGRGASFVPRRPFAAGERVTVRARVRGPGIARGRYHFGVAREPARIAPPPPGAGSPPAPAPPTPADAWHYASRPGLQPPRLDAMAGGSGVLAPGLLFMSPGSVALPGGPEIADDDGNVVWFSPAHGRLVTDVRTQRLGSRRVLTWWRGSMPILGVGRGVDVILDHHYRPVQHVRAGNGLQADLHEFLLTARRTALITAYHPVLRDLRPLGGARAAVVLDSGVQEIDLRTGLVEREWHCLDDVALDETYAAVPSDPAQAFDYCHVNSVAEDRHGNLVVSARNTHAVYDVDHASGHVRWRLGGRRSSYAVPPGATFAWQHDARLVGGGRLSLFDNASEGAAPESRGLVLALHRRRAAATVVREYRSPRHPSAQSQGDLQTLPDGHALVGWGDRPLVSEFAADGGVAREWRYRYAGITSYRTYRLPWVGRPRTRPATAAVADAPGRRELRVSWNGATEVARWALLAGTRRGELRRAGRVRRTGFETGIAIPPDARYVAAVAEDARGRELGRSRVRRLR